MKDEKKNPKKVSTTKLFMINPNRLVGIEKFPDGTYRKVKYVRDTRKREVNHEEKNG